MQARVLHSLFLLLVLPLFIGYLVKGTNLKSPNPVPKPAVVTSDPYSWLCKVRFPGCSRCNSQISKCLKCVNSSYFLKYNKCRKCSSVTSNCYQCYSSGRCKTCNKGYALQGSKCVRCYSPKIVVNNRCVSCQSAWGSACSACTKTGCTKCSRGYYVDYYGQCSRCSSSGCLDCPNDVCRRCDEDKGYYVSNGVCRRCSSPKVVYQGKCVYCSVPFGSACVACQRTPYDMSCTQCQNGYSLDYDGTCTKDNSCNMPGCLNCFNGMCTQCDESNNYVLTPAGQCEMCISPFILNNHKCRTCDSVFGSACSSCDRNACKQCTFGYHLENGYCVSDVCNIEGCLKCQGATCVKCDEVNEYYLTGGICQTCNFPKVIRNNKCQTCSEAFGTGCTGCNRNGCSRCSDGWTLSSGRCVQNCKVVGCLLCLNDQCLQCKPGLVLMDGGCQQTLTFEDIDVTGSGTGDLLPITGYYSLNWDEIGALDVQVHLYALLAASSGKQVAFIPAGVTGTIAAAPKVAFFWNGPPNAHPEVPPTSFNVYSLQLASKSGTPTTVKFVGTTRTGDTEYQATTMPFTRVLVTFPDPGFKNLLSLTIQSLDPTVEIYIDDLTTVLNINDP